MRVWQGCALVQPGGREECWDFDAKRHGAGSRSACVGTATRRSVPKDPLNRHRKTLCCRAGGSQAMGAEPDPSEANGASHRETLPAELGNPPYEATVSPEGLACAIDPAC
jgi:hypothetical protein